MLAESVQGHDYYSDNYQGYKTVLYSPAIHIRCKTKVKPTQWKVPMQTYATTWHACDGAHTVSRVVKKLCTMLSRSLSLPTIATNCSSNVSLNTIRLLCLSQHLDSDHSPGRFFIITSKATVIFSRSDHLLSTSHLLNAKQERSMPLARRDTTQWLPGNYYHIYNREARQKSIFRERANYLFVLEEMGKYCKALDLTPIAIA